MTTSLLLGDCRELMRTLADCSVDAVVTDAASEDSRHFLQQPAGIAPYLALPNANDLEPGLGKVGILRLIDAHSPSLSLIRVGIPGRVAVPVVTIELDNDSFDRKESIDAELARHHCLTLIGTTEAVKGSIGELLQSIRLDDRLTRVHGEETGEMIRVAISTGERAISRCALSDVGWRSNECCATDLARSGNFSSPLPSVGAADRAESSVATSIYRIESGAADFTIAVMASAALWMWRTAVAICAAILSARAQVFGYGNSAPSTNNSAELVSGFARHVTIVAFYFLDVKRLAIGIEADPEIYAEAQRRLKGERIERRPPQDAPGPLFG